MQNLKTVTKYECQHCKKLFSTPNRHNCRRDPDKTNCYTCKHWKRQFSFDKSGWGDDELDYTCSPDEACEKHETSYADEAFDIMRENGWCLDCPEYERTEDIP